MKLYHQGLNDKGGSRECFTYANSLEGNTNNADDGDKYAVQVLVQEVCKYNKAISLQVKYFTFTFSFNPALNLNLNEPQYAITPVLRRPAIHPFFLLAS